ncbi:histidine phosphatase family protein [Pseudomonas solani]|uniref:histidine phosphatase family protein n=1 Tax=Pseudomonas TaxID=286 RepID=UPI0029299D06|nr:histidine phosphatase family protein [Pseudomonas sp. zfem005]MDU9415867.1 histidine phosphatase family protein [Pseudomonas sp. zfem005]
MGSIYLIRHGQASFGADNYDVLSSVGVRQAEVLGDHLASLGLRLDRCVAGSLQRQQHTAEAALSRFRAAGLNAPAVDTDPAFNEFDADAVIRALLPSLLEQEPEALHIMRNAPQNRAEFQRLFSKLVLRWVAGDYDNAELQSWQAFHDQVAGGLERVLQHAESKQNIAVFTSGGTITALLHHVAGVPADRAFELNWQIVNTSLSRLKFRGSEVALASFNSHVHLELLKAPELITYR